MSHANSLFLKIIYTIIPMLILGTGVWGLIALANRKLDPVHVPGDPVPPLVKTLVLTENSGALDLEADGVVAPFREITLAAEVGGKIVRKSENCRAGHLVARGDILFEIDRSDYELEQRRLERQLAQSEANLDDLSVEQSNSEALIESANEEWELQKVELRRVENLKGTLSDSDIDRAKKTEWNSRNSLLTLKNQLQLIKSRRRGLESARDLVQTQLDRAKLDLQRTTIRAPADGIVVRDAVEQESFVQKGAEVVVIEETSMVEVKCNLQMDDLVMIWQHSGEPTYKTSREMEEKNNESAASGSTSPRASSTSTSTGYELPHIDVSITYQPSLNSPKFIWNGVLSRLDGTGVDEKTRTVPCRVVVNSPRDVRVVAGSSTQLTGGPRALLRGMFVHLDIHTQPESQFVQVPEIAVQPGKRVMCVREGKIEMIGPVTLARRIDVATESGLKRYFLVPTSESGLHIGDHVVSSPLVNAEPGLRVREQHLGTEDGVSG